MNIKNSIRDNKTILVLSSINFLIIYLSVFNKSYGYFIDEFYYIACANRPAFGYVDHPPLAPFILTLFQSLLGNSLYALRFLPALAASVAVYMTGVLTKEIGGGKSAQSISAAAVISVPVLLGFAGFFSMNAFEPLLTIVMFYYVIKMVKLNAPQKWIYIGIIIGLGIMNKHTFIVIAGFMMLSLLVTGNYKLFFNKQFIYCCLISFMIVVPNIIWQMQNNFPTIEFYRNITVDKNVYTPPLKFILGQIISFSPASIVLWFSGFLYFLLSKKYKQYRFISVFFLISFLFFLFTATSRADRLSFVYPIIFTAGAIFWENVFYKRNIKWGVYPLILILLSGIALSLPVILPYFNYEQVKEYTRFIGMNTELEKGKKPPLPQILADRIGWEEKVNMTGAAFNMLNPDEKKRTVIAGENYGQAGALELYGKKYNFPLVASGHNNYYLWSKGNLTGKNILLQLGNKREYEVLKRAFDSVYVYPYIFVNQYVSAHENNLQAFICRGPKLSVDEMLENGRNYH